MNAHADLILPKPYAYSAANVNLHTADKRFSMCKDTRQQQAGFGHNQAVTGVHS